MDGLMIGKWCLNRQIIDGWKIEQMGGKQMGEKMDWKMNA